MLTELQYLSLKDCVHVTDSALHALSHRCHKIQFLNLHGCSKITDKGLDNLCEPSIHTNTNCTSDFKKAMYSVVEEGYTGEDDVSTLVQSMSLSRKALPTCDSFKQLDI